MKKNSRNSVFLLIAGVISLLLFFEPGIFKEGKYVKYDSIFDYLKLFFCFLVFIKYVIYKYKEKNYSESKIVILISLYQIFCFFVTIFKSGDIFRFIGPAITSVIITMLIEMLVHYKLLFKSLNYLNYYFRLCFIINLITILISFINHTDNTIYFLGIDNRFVFTYIAWMVCEVLCDINANNRITKKSITVFVLMECSLFIVNTVAAMITFLLWIIPIFMVKNRFINKMKKNMCVTINGILLFDIFITRFRLSYAFSSILNIIGKYPHLSGRVLIWDTIFDRVVPTNFLFGIGMQSEVFDINFFRKYLTDIYAVNHAHNTFVDIIYRFGFIGMIFFAIILYFSIQEINNNSNKYSLALFVSLVILLILGIFDTVLYPGFYFIVALMCNLKFFKNEKIKVKERKNE